MEVELLVERQAVAVTDLLRLGNEAEVLSPPELRAAVADGHRAGGPLRLLSVRRSAPVSSARATSGQS
ncbi:hypothetical protein ACWDKQ_11415 [Saccharopolyspora sp. NPDC000995]